MVHTQQVAARQPYRILIKESALKALKRVAPPMRARLWEAVSGLAEDPWPPGSARLAGEKKLWRLRVGDYRVLYQIRDEDLVVLVVRVGHRGRIYSGM